MESTSVETQTFYFMSETGKLAFAQVIYSNVAYVFPASTLFFAR